MHHGLGATKLPNLSGVRSYVRLFHLVSHSALKSAITSLAKVDSNFSIPSSMSLSGSDDVHVTLTVEFHRVPKDPERSL